MKNALIIEEQFHHQRQKPQVQLHLSPPPTEQQQQLMLEDISPIWASRLKKENLPTFMSPKWWTWRFKLQNASKCVVGEAYGYSSQYTADCDECNTICVKFLYYFTLGMQEKLESNKQDFVKHWNEEHDKSKYTS
jgi:hypothetical protein